MNLVLHRGDTFKVIKDWTYTFAPTTFYDIEDDGRTFEYKYDREAKTKNTYHYTFIKELVNLDPEEIEREVMQTSKGYLKGGYKDIMKKMFGAKDEES